MTEKKIILITGAVLTKMVFAETHEIIVSNFKYEPAKLSIMAGDSVRFEWVEDACIVQRKRIPV